MLPSIYGDSSPSKGAETGSATLPDGFLLDFLYPPRTKAFLRDLAAGNGDKLDRHQGRQSHLNRYREYSSVANVEAQSVGAQNENYGSPFAPNGSHLASASTFEVFPYESRPTQNAPQQYQKGRKSSHDDLESLQTTLRPGKQGVYEEVWRTINSADTTSSLFPSTLADALDHLSTSPEDIDADRVLRLFRKLRKEARRPSSYRAAVAANLKLGKIGRAVTVFQEAASSAATEGIGVDVLLEQIIRRRFWQLGSEVYGAYRAGLGKDGMECASESQQLLKDLTISLNTVTSFASGIWRFPQCFDHRTTSDLMIFLRDLSTITLKQQFEKLFLHPRQSHQRQVNQILRLVKNMRSWGMTSPELYEEAVFILNRRQKVKSPEKANLIYSLYEIFRKERFFSPSKQLLTVMMSMLCHHEPRDEVLRHFTRIEDVAKDWASFHGYLSNEAVRMMLEVFGRAGEVSLVHKYFGYLQSPSKEDLQRSFFWLIYVHSRRADLHKAIWQFERMTQEFSVSPDCECYNALLQAYSRNDDLEGALQRFEEMNSDGVVPDAHTFGILTGIYADRGVPQCVSELFSTANSHGVDPTPHMWAALVRAHIENDDLTTAEKIAEESSRSKATTEPVTIVWNQIITAHALRRDLESTSRIFKRMQQDQVPLDSLTYAALMQCLVLLRQYDAARKILQKVMPKERQKRLAFHFAILMGGYVESRQWSRVLGLNAVMRRRGIKATVSTRIPVLKAQVAVETNFLHMQSQGRPPTRLSTTEQALADVLEDSDRREATSAIKQPNHGLEGFSMNETYPDAYYEVLISTYGRRNAFDIVDDVFEEYLRSKEHRSSSSFVPPLKFLTALMRSHWRAREYDDIEQCWLLFYRKAMHYVKVAPVPKPDLGSTPSEALPLQPLLSPTRMAPSRRHIISPPLTFFMRSLSQRGEILRLISLIDELTTSGWVLSNRVWNLYVQSLIAHAHTLHAFQVCEQYLMPGWPGWRRGRALQRSQSRSQKQRGFDRINIKNVLPSMLLPQYPTMVILARAMLNIQRASAYASQEKVSIREIREKAPKTVRAVETMPLLPHDPVQRNLLGSAK
ncbi:MAG: hypothetical protein Q9165_008200 [Trypethelium subeluteriae]